MNSDLQNLSSCQTVEEYNKPTLNLVKYPIKMLIGIAAQENKI